jgi:glycosyltransferase involved in cell wall biosynthesis
MSQRLIGRHALASSTRVAPIASDRSGRRAVRVLQVIDHLDVGGAQSVLLALLTLLDRSRFVPSVATFGAVHPDLGDRIAQLCGRIHVMRYRPVWDPRTALALARLMREEHTDVVHAHLTLAEWHAGLAATLVRRRMVSTLHSIAEDREASGWASRSAAAFATKRLSARLLAVGEGVAASHLSALGAASTKLEVLRNVPVAPLLLAPGFDRRLKRAELGLTSPLVTSVSRLAAMRDHETLIRAAAEIVGEVPTLSVALLGEGEEEHRLRALVRDLRLEGSVRFMGTRIDAPEIMAASDVICQPTLYEGLPITVLDAMSLGLPVVASDVPGNAELLEDGESGLLVPVRNAAALAAALRRLLGQPELAERLGAAAQERVARRFSASAWIARIQAVYEELADGR